MTPTTKAQAPLPPCSRCGSPLFDNRADRASSKSPLARCSDVNCTDPKTGRRTAFWKLEELGLVAAKQPAAPAAPKHEPPQPATPDTANRFQEVSRAHYRALKFVLEHEAPLIQSLGGDVASAVAAMTATVFIEFHRNGNGGNHK